MIYTYSWEAGGFYDMKKKFRLSVALDIDDVLMECIPYAIRLANEKYNYNPPLSIYEVDRWGKLDTRADVIFEFFRDPEFFRSQPIIKGAQEFVRKLSEVAEVFVSTSVYPEYMSIRALRIMQDFPEIPQDHIYMGAGNDRIDVDILLDDGMHNVFRSNASYPILMRRPWNQDATGMLAVNNYDEFLKLVEVIADSYNPKHNRHSAHQPGIFVLVGPSGSGKNEIARHILEKSDEFEKLVSYTTDASAVEKGGDWYHYVTVDEFHKMYDSNKMFEATVYAGNSYGSCKSDVKKILKAGKHVLTIMDICGAMSLKTHFTNVSTIFVKRPTRMLLENLLTKPISLDEKVRRIMSLESEQDNAAVCDYTVNAEDFEKAAEQIISSVKSVKCE